MELTLAVCIRLQLQNMEDKLQADTVSHLVL